MPKLIATKHIRPPKKEHEIGVNIWGPKLRDWRDVVEDYIRILKNRHKNKLCMFKLQVNILQDIIGCEYYITLGKKIKKEPSKIKDYVDTDVKEEEFDFDDFYKQINQEKLIRKILKEIMDGYLWRLFNYDRGLIYAMGWEGNPGNLRYDPAFIREFQDLGDAIKDPQISHFLLNDLSNFARIGDVITKNKESNIEVREIKSTSSMRGRQRQERLKRQEEKRKNFEELANKREGISNEKEIKLISSDVVRKSNLKILLNALKETNVTGISGRKINRFLSIICMDVEVNSRRQSAKNDFDRLFNQYVKPWQDKGQEWLFIESSLRNKFSPNFTPLSIFPFPESIIADLLCMKKIVFYYFNIYELINFIKSTNWSVKDSILDYDKSYDPRNSPFCHIQFKELTIDVSWYLINQLIFDLLNPKSFISIYDYVYNNHKNPEKHIMINFSNEQECWT